MIAIVNDDESVRESTKSLVRSLGYAARTFPSVEEFLRSDLDDIEGATEAIGLGRPSPL